MSPVASSSNSLMYHHQMSPTQPTGMFTRNLIGSLAASASRLIDPSDKIGIWFILQDLSVRTEGSFRFVSPGLRTTCPTRADFNRSRLPDSASPLSTSPRASQMALA